MNNMNKKINIIDGDISIDDRGKLSFVNGFNFLNVKRFYQVENFNLNVVRAFHGHMREEKYVYVSSGSIILCLAKLSADKTLNKKDKPERIVLSATKPKIVHIPSGYANGFKVLEENTKIIFFSTTTLEESSGDDYRFPYDYFGKSIWNIDNR